MWSSNRFADPLLEAILARRFGSEGEALAFVADTAFQAPADDCLPNIAAAVARVAAATANQERIVVFGDYDVDGVAATALCVLAIQAASGGTANLGARLPSRADGYGLRPEVIREIAASGATLLITVDCGSSDHENIDLARELGMDVVVFDHHQLTGPPVDATVVSTQLAGEAACRDLSAAGVLYLFAVALTRAGFDLGNGPGEEPTRLLDLASLGLIADVVPLSGLARSMVRAGLRQLRAGRRPGLSALAGRAGVTLDAVTSEDVAFKLAPRLNAAGRMDNPRLALGLLLTDDPATAERRVSQLEQLNRQRRAATDLVFAEARAQVGEMAHLDRRRILLVHAPNWHAGVLGVVAAKLTDAYGRPAVVLSDADGVSRGSARSVPGFDIGRAIAASSELVLGHGGHCQAAGLTMETALVPDLIAALEAAADRDELPLNQPAEILIDADLPVERLERATAELLSVLEPFGAGNPKPLLRLRGARLHSYRALGQDGRHLKLFVSTPGGEVAILAWNASGRSRELVGRRRLDLVVTLGVDRWNGQRRLHAELKDFRALD
ncbi:MAG: single-stranded-DNA-specific exonuclease RecJ [Chloroflexota bacterium]|nr:single-stranded-DNA-specific exonuclease RecJ [Chloroflexota bacterium]